MTVPPGPVPPASAPSGFVPPGGPAADVSSDIPDISSLERVTPMVFKAGCPDCRARFELSAPALRLAIGGSATTTFYSFTCPECGAGVRKPAGERIVELLIRGGVRTLRLHSTV